MIKKILLAVLFPILLFAQTEQTNYSDEDVAICNNKFELSVNSNLHKNSIGYIVSEIGKSFLGTPYKAFTLEKGDSESVMVNLSGLDCYTLFESTLAIARCVKSEKYSFESYLAEIENLRYRNGKLDGYVSRLHYASDWLYDNAKRHIVKDVTKQIGGVLYHPEVGFMGSNSDKYKRLKGKTDLITKIKEIENNINSREYYFIPQENVAKVESKIQNGDILLLTTGIKGLDIGHTGIAVKMDSGRIHFLHAPIAGSQVQISKEPLAEYVQKVKKHTGLMVVRPLAPIK